MASDSTNGQVLSTNTATYLVNFMHVSERLKDELRHSFTSGGRQESVAEHCWRVGLLALLMRPYLPQALDWERLLEMLIIHDLAEARTGDIPVFDAKHQDKTAGERAAIQGYRELLPDAIGVRISDLWEEFEEGKTLEAQIANALDKLEAQIQHNEADLSTWLEWEKNHALQGFAEIRCCDPNISILADAIVHEARKKLGSIKVESTL